MNPWRSIKDPPAMTTMCDVRVKHADGSVATHKGPIYRDEAAVWRRRKPAKRLILGEVIAWREIK